MAKHVGIKELKDRASSLINEIEKKRKPITITRNNKEVAQIIPIAFDSEVTEEDRFRSMNEKLKDLGRISQLPKQDWASLRLKKVLSPESDDVAIRAISEDRGE